MLFSRVLGDTTYQTALLPTLLVAALLLGHLALVALALSRSSLQGAVPLALGVYLGVAGILGLIWLQADHFDGTAHCTRVVFWPLLLLDSTAMVMSLASALGAIPLIRRTGWAGVLAVLTGLGLGGAHAHWTKLTHHPVLPIASVKGAPFFHLGRERSLTYRLAFESGQDFPGLKDWRLDGPPQSLRADRPQSFPLLVRATSEPIALETRLLVQAVADRQEESPLLPLAVGNTWEFAVTSRCKFASGRTSVNRQPLFLRITGEEVHDGLRQYQLARGINADVNQFVAAVFAAGGATYFVDSWGQTLHPIEALAGDACQLNLFGVAGRCIRGQSGSDLALSGPLRFTRDANVTTAGGILTGVLTLGFSRPEPRDCEEDYELVRSFGREQPAK